MKTLIINYKFIFMTLMFLPLAICSSDDDSDNNPDDNNNNSSIFYENTINKGFDAEGIYVASGVANRIKTDNPSVDNLPRSGQSAFESLGIDPNTAVFVTVTGQKTNNDKNVFDIPIQSNFGYNAVTFVYSIDENSTITPNARITTTTTVTHFPNGIQGQDVNGQTIHDLTAGKFKITALVDGILGYKANADGSQGAPVQSVEYTVDTNYNADDGGVFPRREDGTLTVKIDDNLLDDVQVQDVILELFSQGGGNIDIYILETIDGNPDTSEIDAITIKGYDL